MDGVVGAADEEGSKAAGGEFSHHGMGVELHGDGGATLIIF